MTANRFSAVSADRELASAERGEFHPTEEYAPAARAAGAAKARP